MTGAALSPYFCVRNPVNKSHRATTDRANEILKTKNMSGTAKTHHPSFTVPVEKKQTATTTAQSEFWKMVEFNRFGIIPMLMVALVCISGIAAGFGAPGNPFQLSIVSVPTAVALSLVLAVAPMKWIVYSSAFAILLDIIILIV
jgi:hypothetical protein